MPVDELMKQWAFSLRTSAGELIHVRPLRADDRERERAFVESLSERTRYLRLFTPLKFLPPQLIDHLMDVDYERRMAFVATIERDGREEIIGVARYGLTDDTGTAEMGITVADAWHRRGIGRLLLEHLMRFARAHGVHRLTGIVLAENTQMIAFARSLGFSVRFDAESHSFEIARDLDDGAGSRASPADLGANACALRESPG